MIDETLQGRLQALLAQKAEPEKMPWSDVIKALGYFKGQDPVRVLDETVCRVGRTTPR